MASTYELVREFKRKYPTTVSWGRTRKHANLVDKNLFPNEKVLFAFAAQNDEMHLSMFNTAVLALTTERLIVAQDRFVGFKLSSITPELYNDMQIRAGLFWGMITIDTMKEVIYFSNISKRALSEIQVQISSYMIEAKKKTNKKDSD